VKISYRIFLGFTIILAAGFYFLVTWIMKDVNRQPKKSMEESLIETSRILAAYLEHNIRDGAIETGPLQRFLDTVEKRRFRARIYELDKEEFNMGVYVTDKRGIVIFDSNNGLWEGRDFSRRNDVYLTLQGNYGARTTRLDPGDPVSSVAYVAAPVYFRDEIIGVCTVSKPWKRINTFLEATRNKILLAAATLFIAALVLSFFISRWITRPIRHLTIYADFVKEGLRVTLPELGKGEIRELGDSFEQMRESLEGKDYIERYVQTLTHQLKGPLSAIRGAAELLQEELPEPDRKRFITNIETESNRLQRIVERMLELASLEQQKELRNVETIDLGEMVTDISDEMTVTLKKKEIVLVLNVGKGFRFKGERFLIHQAVYNLLQNAVEFTPQGGTITVEIKRYWGRLILIISDDGAGIPEYALDKVFDKFYSLQRPDTGKKSSGLGLSMVKEVVELHKGEITIKPNSPNGTTVVLKLPVGPSKVPFT
jgi:two-component system sensor histidine kinase CreC